VNGRTPAQDTLPHPVPGTPTRIVFVCTGNICRSPMAEVAARAMADATALVDGTTLGDQLIVTSAGTGPWHEGEPMDPRTAAALRRAGYPDHPHIAHQISTVGLAETDLIVALDRRHQQTLRKLGTDPSRLVLLRSFDPSAGAATDVPDPYYGDEAGFDDCLSMIALGCHGLVVALAAQWDAVLSPELSPEPSPEPSP
jgi:protein-tyrosine phosphatase